jgi:hypothetical protein
MGINGFRFGIFWILLYRKSGGIPERRTIEKIGKIEFYFFEIEREKWLDGALILADYKLG